MSLKNRSQRPIRKRPFLLFEILASTALVALCLLPLIRPHAAMRNAKVRYLEEVQMENIVQSAFCAFKVKLYENKEHSWEQLMEGARGELDGTFTVVTGPNTFKQVRCSYKTSFIDDIDKSSQNKVAMVIEVEFSFTPSQVKTPGFKRTLLLERHIL